MLGFVKACLKRISYTQLSFAQNIETKVSSNFCSAISV